MRKVLNIVKNIFTIIGGVIINLVAGYGLILNILCIILSVGVVLVFAGFIFIVLSLILSEILFQIMLNIGLIP